MSLRTKLAQIWRELRTPPTTTPKIFTSSTTTSPTFTFSALTGLEQFGLSRILSSAPLPREAGFINPLHEYLTPFHHFEPLSLITALYDYNGFMIEISSFNDQLIMLRANSDGNLINCQDYGTVLLDEKEKVKAILIADGVSQTIAAQMAAYEIVQGFKEQIRLLNSTAITAKTINNLFNNIGDHTAFYGEALSREVIVEKITDAFETENGKQYSLTLNQLHKNAIEQELLGATTLLGIILGGKNQNSSISASPINWQFGYLDHQWRYSGKPQYATESCSSGDIVGLFTDGCMKKKYTTSASILTHLGELQKQHNYTALSDLGFVLFRDLIGEPTITPMSSSKKKRIADDALLVLYRV